MYLRDPLKTYKRKCYKTVIIRPLSLSKPIPKYSVRHGNKIPP